MLVSMLCSGGEARGREAWGPTPRKFLKFKNFFPGLDGMPFAYQPQH